MSRFFSNKYSSLTPYTPGEQPRDVAYIKLNTNESPYPPSPKAQKLAALALDQLMLYPDPDCKTLRETAAAALDISVDEILFTNGSDDVLNFAFMAFCDDTCGAAFPDITYGFYSVFAQLNGIDYVQIPLTEDFSVRAEDYIGLGRTIFIANPNAPTGKALPLSQIERIVAGNPNNVVVVDEAYVDFGAQSAVQLIGQYDNLLVTQTFSKSRSMAGARLGMGIGSKALIKDLNTVRYSTNPYNINRMTMAAGIGALDDEAYFRENCQKIQKTRAWTMQALQSLGFTVVDSMTNFVFAAHPKIDGKTLYTQLKQRRILVRHFDAPRLTAYNRITIGTPEQMGVLIDTLKEILEETL